MCDKDFNWKDTMAGLENIQTNPMEGLRKFQWGWGVSKAKLFLKNRIVWGLTGISRGGWAQTIKTFRGSVMDIF